MQHDHRHARKRHLPPDAARKRRGQLLLCEDRNPNTNGARLLRIASDSGAVLQQIKEAVGSGQVQALISLGENPLGCGITTEQLTGLSLYLVMDLLANDATPFASVV